MKFSHQHTIPASANAVWELSSDPDFAAASYAKANATHEVLKTEQKNGKTIKHIRVTFKDPLPSIAAKVVGSTHLSYEQIETIDPKQRRNDWVILLPKIGKKVKAEGFFFIAEKGTQSTRIMEGEVKVLIRFIGGKVEQFIAKQLEKSQSEIAQLMIEKLS